MNSINGYSRLALTAALLFALLPAGSALAQALPDSITVGTVSGSGTVDVPVYIRDVAGTPLGIDQPVGSRIQSYSIKVDYASAANVSGITFTRAGITTALTPAFESSPSAAGTISLLDNFVEATNLIPFVSNAAAPGNQVAHLLVTIPPAVPPGTVITLTLDPTLTQLTNQGGTTQETTGNGSLALVNGSITVTAAGPPIPTLSYLGLALLAISLGFIAVRLLK
ncbi:MAG: hypothetical protein WC538_24425 [Thermoanaerobaculia bacterium]|jgi:hypothetical protein